VSRVVVARRDAERASSRAHAADPYTFVGMRYLVDGMNVIGTRPDSWWKDRDAAMLRLVRALERWAAEDGEDVTVLGDVLHQPPARARLPAG